MSDTSAASTAAPAPAATSTTTTTATTTTAPTTAPSSPTAAPAAPAPMSWADRAALNRPPSSVDVPTISTPSLSESVTLQPTPEHGESHPRSSEKGQKPSRSGRNGGGGNKEDRRSSTAGQKNAGRREGGERSGKKGGQPGSRKSTKTGEAAGETKTVASGTTIEGEGENKEAGDASVTAAPPAPKKKVLPGAPKVNPWKVKPTTTISENTSASASNSAETSGEHVTGSPTLENESALNNNTTTINTIPSSTTESSFPSLAPAPAKKHRSKQKVQTNEQEGGEAKKGKKEKTKWKPVPQHELQFTTDLSTERKKSGKPRSAGPNSSNTHPGAAGRKKKNPSSANAGKKTKKTEDSTSAAEISIDDQGVTYDIEAASTDMQSLGLNPAEGDIQISKEVEKSLMKSATDEKRKVNGNAAKGGKSSQASKGAARNGQPKVGHHQQVALNATTDSFQPNQEFFYNPHPHVAGRAGGPFPSAPVPPNGSMPTGQIGKHQAGVEAYYTPPPMPIPVTIPGFQLDPLRFYLLGQLEYYFGIQNLAMDFFLRQQMDTLGYVSLSMVASFNRVKNLTTDLSLVRETMLLSQLVEVRDVKDETKVRLANNGWAQWVLPGAPVSVVEEGVENGEKSEDVVVQARQAEESREDVVIEEKKDREEEEAVDAAL